jgi:hypothetical protein
MVEKVISTHDVIMGYDEPCCPVCLQGFLVQQLQQQHRQQQLAMRLLPLPCPQRVMPALGRLDGCSVTVSVGLTCMADAQECVKHNHGQQLHDPGHTTVCNYPAAMTAHVADDLRLHQAFVAP